MNDMDDSQLKRELPFDLYGRYAIARDLINRNRKDAARFRILDVGGRGNHLRQFLPDDDVFFLDPNIGDEEKAENYVSGDGRDMDAEDESFDYVVSADVFEHVDPDGREGFLRENLRVAKFGVILSAPFDSGDTARADAHANENYRIISHGQDHAWLKEHLDRGLPKAGEVEAILEAGGLSFQKIPNNDLSLWQILIIANFIAGEQVEAHKDLNQFYNEDVFPHDHGESAYRTIYFIKKDKSLKDLELPEPAIGPGLQLEAAQHGLSLLSRIYAQDKETIARLSRENETAQKKLVQMKNELDETSAQLDQKLDEIDGFRATFSWKITAPLRLVRSAQRKLFDISRRSKAVLQSGGPGAFAQKAAGFLVRRFLPRYSARFGVNLPQVSLENSRWYEQNRKPVTVVIPSYNDHQVLKKCLDSIDRTTDRAFVDIVIVDDASPDAEHQAFLRSLDRENVTVLHNDVNGGFAKAVNTGLRAVESRDVVILNSDIEAKRYWLECLQCAAYSDEKIGITGGKLLYPDGKIQYAGSHRKDHASVWFDHYHRFMASSFGPANIPNYMIGITGACMYVKQDVIRDIGYMDENFPMAFEDMDYCIRAWNEGYRSLYYPAATLVHHESASRGTRQGEREKESLRYFWEKWGDWFDVRNVLNEEGRVRIIYVLQSTGVGGGHRLVFEQINRLTELGLDVELFALEEQPAWFPLKVRVRTFENYERLIEALEKEEAIKVATWWETAEPVWLASVNRGIPVYYVQDIETSYYEGNFYMQQVVLSRYKKEFHYLTESGWNAEQLEKMGLSPAMVGCGIDETIFRPSGEAREANVLLALGRGNPLKNLGMTIDAWRGIEANQPELWMFGIEPELAEGLSNARYFLRPSDDEVNSLYNRATVFVQSSRHEGFCLPVLEAMAAGAAVICTDAHGNADFCFDEVNCLMVKQDDVDGLRSAIVRLFSDVELRERLRQEGYRTAARYSWPVVMNQVAEFYQDLSGAPSPATLVQ